MLVEYLASDYRQDYLLVWMAVDAIKKVLDMSAGLPRNDFCRLFARSGLLVSWSCPCHIQKLNLPQYPLVTALLRTTSDTQEDAPAYADRICEILLLLSSADTMVNHLWAKHDTNSGLG